MNTPNLHRKKLYLLTLVFSVSIVSTIILSQSIFNESPITKKIGYTSTMVLFALSICILILLAITYTYLESQNKLEINKALTDLNRGYNKDIKNDVNSLKQNFQILKEIIDNLKKSHTNLERADQTLQEQINTLQQSSKDTLKKITQTKDELQKALKECLINVDTVLQDIQKILKSNINTEEIVKTIESLHSKLSKFLEDKEKLLSKEPTGQKVASFFAKTFEIGNESQKCLEAIKDSINGLKENIKDYQNSIDNSDKSIRLIKQCQTHINIIGYRLPDYLEKNRDNIKKLTEEDKNTIIDIAEESKSLMCDMYYQTRIINIECTIGNLLTSEETILDQQNPESEVKDVSTENKNDQIKKQ